MSVITPLAPAPTTPARLGRLIARQPWLLYLVITPLAHPILEILLFGERALQTAHDVFDDDIPRLFSIPADWLRYGPSLWDPHLTAGNGLFAQFALPPLAPDVLLAFVLPPFVAYTLNAALMAFLAGLGMHLFLRDSLRLPAIACFAGGIASTFAYWHYILGFAALLLPLVLLWTERAVSPARRPRDVVAAALLVGFMGISSQVQVVALVAGVALAWAVMTSESGRAGVGAAARFFVPWLAGAALAAPVLLSLLVAVSTSQRTLWSLDVPVNPIGTWLEQLGDLLFGVRRGVLNDTNPLYGSWFPGIVGLALLALALVVPRRGRPERAALWLLLGVLAADLVALLAIQFQNGVGPLGSFQFLRVRHLVPPLVVVNLAVAIGWLAAPGRLPLGVRRLATFVALLGLAGTALVYQLRPLATPIARWLERGAPTGSPEPALVGTWLVAGAFAIGGVALVVAAVLLALGRRERARPGAGRRALGALAGSATVVVLVLGLGLERLAYTRGNLLLHSGMGAWADYVPATAAHEFIARQPGGGRVVSFIEHANRSLSAGLHAADGYQTVYPVRYHALFGSLLRPQLRAHPDLSAYYNDFGNRAYLFNEDITKPVADLLGIRWLLVAPHSAVDATLRSKFSHPGTLDPAFVLRFAAPDGRLVYENPAAFPRAFVVHDWAVHPTRRAALDAIDAATSDDLRSTAHLIDREAGVAGLGTPPGGPSTSPGTATITLDTPDRIEIRAHAETAGLLVLADTYAPGWVAEVDGRPVEIVPVDIALRGVALPAGEHLVTFRYRPLETLAGFVIAAVTALLGIAWLLLPRLRRGAPRQTAVPLSPRVDVIRPLDPPTAPPDRAADRPPPGPPARTG